MGEAERGEAAPRQAVTYFCSHEHRSVVTFAQPHRDRDGGAGQAGRVGGAASGPSRDDRAVGVVDQQLRLAPDHESGSVESAPIPSRALRTVRPTTSSPTGRRSAS